MDDKFTKWTGIFTALLTVEFMMRSTAPVGWVPLLLIKVIRDNALVSFIISAFLVAAPTLFAIVVLDSYYYSFPMFNGDGTWKWVFNPWNFVKFNVIDKGSE